MSVRSNKLIYPAASSTMGKFNSEYCLSTLVNALSNPRIILSNASISTIGSKYYLNLSGLVIYKGYMAQLDHSVSSTDPMSGTALEVKTGDTIYFGLVTDSTAQTTPSIVTEYVISTNKSGISDPLVLGKVTGVTTEGFQLSTTPKVITSTKDDINEVYHELTGGSYLSVGRVIDVLHKLGIPENASFDSNVPEISTECYLSQSYLLRLVDRTFEDSIDTSDPGHIGLLKSEIRWKNSSSDNTYHQLTASTDDISTDSSIGLVGFNVKSSDGSMVLVDSVNKRVWNAVYNDYAEWYLADPSVEFHPGDVIVKKPGTEYYTKSYKSGDNLVVGVVSDSYGMCLGGDSLPNMMDNLGKYIPVGLAGRVTVNVSGDVFEGDLLESGTDGRAHSVVSYVPGRVLGKALSNSNDGKVLMQIMLM